MEEKRGMAMEVLVELDEWGNYLLGGSEEQTMSAHAYQMELEGKPWGFMRQVIDDMPMFGRGHCERAYIHWLEQNAKADLEKASTN